jgi:glycine C-acetyltransferase
VLAGIDVVEKEPELRELLLENARYAIQKLQPFGIISKPEAAIIALKVPDWMDVRNANHFIHEQGIFLNAIEYPAVPEGEERFRISITAEHTRADIDRLAEVLDMVWNSPIVHKT